jgi:endonuclease/exonuclease/phosphatase family metal-dependent hydrolase
VRRELRIYDEVGVGRDDGHQAGEYAAILYDRNRLELLNEGHFWLSGSPELPGSMTWGNRYPRIVTWARLRDRATRSVFLAVNTHWDHESQEAREKGAHLMVNRLMPLGDVGDPLLIVGDLNCSRDNRAFQILEGSSAAEPENRPWWTDTFEVMFPRGIAGSGTFHAFTGDRGGAKIDFVLVWPLKGRAPAYMPTSARREWRVLQAGIVHTNENGRYPSDHFPVTATLLLVDAPPNGQSSTM